MGKEFHLKTPLTEEDVRQLRIADTVYLTGKIYTLRDRGHLRLFEYTDAGKELPIDLEGAVIWHCGPVVRQKGEKWEVASAGPTTSSRFDRHTPRLIKDFSVRGMIGKGGMGANTIEYFRDYGSVFLSAPGGCAALMAQRIKEVTNLYWSDMGLPEAIWELEVENFGALIVAIDSEGQSLYQKVEEEVGERLAACYEGMKVDPNIRYIFFPPEICGTPEVADLFKK